MDNKKEKTKIDAAYTKDQFDCDLEMLKYFHEEFIYRHKHYWNIMFKVFTLVVIISLLPLTSEIAGVKLNETARLYSLCFPVVSFLIACLGKFILDDEATKLSAVNKAKYTLNQQYMIERYHYYYYNPDVGKKPAEETTTQKEADRKAKRWLSVNLINKIFAVELFITFTSAVLIALSIF